MCDYGVYTVSYTHLDVYKRQGLYTAELYALWQALCFCEHGGDRQFVICTDSMSFLTGLTVRAEWIRYGNR